MARKQKVQQQKPGKLGIPGVDDLAEPEAPKPVKRDAVRVVSLLVVIAALVVLVVQNTAAVTIRFLVFKPHIGLIWLVVVSVAAGLVLGLLLARQRRRARAAKKSKPGR